MLTKNEPAPLRSVAYDGTEITTEPDPLLSPTIGVQCKQAQRHRERVRAHLIRSMSWRLLPGESWFREAA